MKIFIDKSRNDITRTVTDHKGTYSIPFIQSENILEVESESLVRMKRGAAEHTCRRTGNISYYENLSPGEYSLEAGGKEYYPVGIGTIVAAIGDSITEGYHSRGFKCSNLNLKKDDFPEDAVSKDGRNFPQYSPTAGIHKPDVNCMQSWMSGLNDLLTRHFQQPFFIANEGWGGYTSGQYLHMVRTDGNWQKRIFDLKPNMWLIHLGVNDEREGVPVESFYENMSQLLSILTNEFAAVPRTIRLARPCYDYLADFGLMKGYLEKIKILTEKFGISEGPDFYKAYSVDKEKWYGDDPVHPNLAGMRYMAELWFDNITRRKFL